ncbi:hypothetical protein ABIC83_002438 [Roseateles asaccharophilus]
MSSTSGSSPRPRGPLKPLKRRQAIKRFIPAPAGNAQPATSCSPCRPVHPRSPGELMPGFFVTPERIGSSPRPRGPRMGPEGRQLQLRFIPAPAGTTPDDRSAPCLQAVHPSIRGDHNISKIIALHLPGSSPHPRGPLDRSQQLELQARFIPAPAGTTSSRGHTSRCASVHPRTRGDHATPPSTLTLPSGSSPHPRGPRGEPTESWVEHRFIPAPAGTTPIASRCPTSGFSTPNRLPISSNVKELPDPWRSAQGQTPRIAHETTA